MEPITIIALLLVGAAAATATWAAIETWIDINKVPNGTAEIVRHRISAGKYQIVAGIFDQHGTQLRSESWIVSDRNSEINRQFNQKGDVIRVFT